MLGLILSDLLTLSCLHHFLLEFTGSALFLCLGQSGVLMLSNHHSDPCPLQVALLFGLSVAMTAVCVGGAAHLNPAVTVAMALTLKLRLWKAALHLIGQLLGGVASAALMLALSGDITPIINKVAPGVRLYQAFAVETLVTLQLVLVVLVTEACPQLIGPAVTLGHMVAVSVTGCGMNPARSFGPALVTLDFTNHWVFWAGPCLGACLAALINDLLLRQRWRRPGDWWAELKQLHVLTEKDQEELPSHTQ